eukprot:3618437-Alexandrium_andersonii.AAC.1
MVDVQNQPIKHDGSKVIDFELGGGRFDEQTVEAKARFEVGHVSQPVISMGRSVRRGHVVILTKDGSWVEKCDPDKYTTQRGDDS